MCNENQWWQMNYLGGDLSKCPFFVALEDLSSNDMIKTTKAWTAYIYLLLEIKPCGLGSRIRDMEGERHN